MLNEFKSCSSRLLGWKLTHSQCSAFCRKRVGWVRCKCNQNLERNESARKVTFFGKRYSIARSFAKGNDAYSPYRTGAGVCSNELECVAFVSSRNLTRRSTPGERTRCIIFKIFLHKPSLARGECVYETNISRFLSRKEIEGRGLGGIITSISLMGPLLKGIFGTGVGKGMRLRCTMSGGKESSCGRNNLPKNSRILRKGGFR